MSEDRFDGVDILANNASIQYTAPLKEFSRVRWDGILALNISSCFHSARAVLYGMKRRKWGRAINIASARGLMGSSSNPAYVAAKHGALRLTKVEALETAEEGIAANAICRGYARAPLADG